ncbi:Bax inhibitor-1/YccA family protein [Methanococcus voltae]|uniref:Bax inhibitor-1/YccA family protein n=1 Tax=Methanococcus voltae TaxID=2188 RepID=UPI001AE17A4A|nr:Bax inhibitor-1/YccA family protein [Methanococcus voltae]MBP2172816.1 putative YccA/Bax inhibitor family protein [Methanococcus voltae]
MKSSNPVFGTHAMERYRQLAGSTSSMPITEQMTINGSINKIFILTIFLIGSAVISWTLYASQPGFAGLLGMGGIIVGFILALIISFKNTTAPILSPIYAICEGLAMGFISAVFETMYPGIAFQASFGTFGVLLTMIFVYKFRIIKVTEKFKTGLLIATGGIALLYLLTFILSFFGIYAPFIYEGGIIGIGFSLLVIGVASLNLLLDFDFIEKGAEYGLPKHMEWYGAFGILVTVVWVYLEILRLLAKLRQNE